MFGAAEYAEHAGGGGAGGALSRPRFACATSPTAWARCTEGGANFLVTGRNISAGQWFPSYALWRRKDYAMRYSRLTTLRGCLLPLAALVGATTLAGCVTTSTPPAYAYSYNYPAPYYSSYTVTRTYPNGYVAAYSPDYNGSYDTYGTTAGNGR